MGLPTRVLNVYCFKFVAVKLLKVKTAKFSHPRLCVIGDLLKCWCFRVPDLVVVLGIHGTHIIAAIGYFPRSLLPGALRDREPITTNSLATVSP